MLAFAAYVDWILAALAAISVFSLWVANTALGECTRLRRDLNSAKDWIGEIERRHANHSEDVETRFTELSGRPEP